MKKVLIGLLASLSLAAFAITMPVYEVSAFYEGGFVPPVPIDKPLGVVNSDLTADYYKGGCVPPTPKPVYKGNNEGYWVGDTWYGPWRPVVPSLGFHWDFLPPGPWGPGGWVLVPN